MAEQGKHGIAWCTTTWNCIRGCSRVSEGCRHCYAERVAARFSGPGQPYEGLARLIQLKARSGIPAHTEPHWTGIVRMVPEHLEDPLRWKRPRIIFVNSMSDLFHEALAEEDILKVIDVMIRSLRKTNHIFQVLTKRPERMREILTKISPIHMDERIWWGVSVEDQKTADKRIPILLETPAIIRWVSYEPALGPVDFCNLCGINSLTGMEASGFNTEAHLSWVVMGGESGPGARPMDKEWASQLRRQCQEAKVSFFFKQGSQDAQWGMVGYKNFDQFPEELQVREYPKIEQ